MNYYLENVYEIFRNYLKSMNPDLKSVKQYNPHNGFSKKNLFKDDKCKMFEEMFPTLLVQDQYVELNSLIEKMKEEISAWDASNKSNKTYCNKFLDFLSIVINKKGQQKYVKAINSFYHIDGNDTLVEAMGGQRVFLKKVLEKSYFFAPNIVTKRFADIKEKYDAQEPIPARWQEERKSGIKEQCGYKYCQIDTNGNNSVRSIIRDNTGYTVSAGKSSIFQNYKISHVWGRAFDPRYFTQLWNVALVPAWANDPMDKPSPHIGSITSKMQNTFRAICVKLYKMDIWDWNGIGIDVNDILATTDIVKGTYNVNLLEKGGPYQPGKISQVSITI